MIKRKILGNVLLFFFLVSVLIPFCSAFDSLNETNLVPQPQDLSVDAKAAYLIDAGTGDVLYGMNEADELYPASTTKIMTCYLTLKYGSLNDLYTLPDGISSGMDENSSTSHLQPGEELYISELLQCLMISSANEAANALAIYISGSIDEFVDLMNEEAAELGCTNTHFENPNGLHSDNHYTSAKDLALITIAALQYDAFRNVCSTASTTLRATNLSEARTLENTNYLLPGTDFSGYDYAGAEGVKTGHTTPAGYCLVSLVSRNGHELLGVILGASESETDDQIEIGSFTESIKMLDWGFENYDTAVVYQQYLSESAEDKTTGADQDSDSSSDFEKCSETQDEAAASPESVSEEAAEDTEIDSGAAITEGTPIETDNDSSGLSAEPSGNIIASGAANAAEAAASEADTGESDSPLSTLQKTSMNLKISSTDLVLLLAGSTVLILLLILLIVCCSYRRKLVTDHGI